MLLVPILASLGVVRLAISILTCQEKGGLARTYKQSLKGASVALLGMGVILLAATYEDEDVYKLLHLARLEALSFLRHWQPAFRLQLLESLQVRTPDTLINRLWKIEPFAPGILRTLAFGLFVKAILMGSDAFRWCDYLENPQLIARDVGLSLGKGQSNDDVFVEEVTVIPSDSERTVGDICLDPYTPVSKTITTRESIIARARTNSSSSDTAVESTIIIQLTSDSGSILHPTVLNRLDTVVTETLSTLIPATIRAMGESQMIPQSDVKALEGPGAEVQETFL